MKRRLIKKITALALCGCLVLANGTPVLAVGDTANSGVSEDASTGTKGETEASSDSQPTANEADGTNKATGGNTFALSEEQTDTTEAVQSADAQGADTETQDGEVSDNEQQTEDAENPEGAENLQSEDVTEETNTREATEDSAASNTVDGSLALNGNEDNWKNVNSQSGNNVNNWKTAINDSGDKIAFSYSGTSSSEWDYTYASGSNSFTIKFSDGSEKKYYVVYDGSKAVIKNEVWADIAGDATIINRANHNTAGPYFIEFALPLEMFNGKEIASIGFGGSNVDFGSIQQFSGVVTETPVQPVYTGISNDGTFNDWAAVTKVDVTDPNGEIVQAAMVWDGDGLHVYIRERDGGMASHAGSHGNGKFTIKTDLGHEYVFQLNSDGTVSGLGGITGIHIGAEWEITIPGSELPGYLNTVDLALYEGATLVPGIANKQGTEYVSEFAGVTYDGKYEDWKDYGHETIQYATAGSQASVIDGKGAVYWGEDKIYAHVYTAMPEHLQEGGGEFTSAVTFVFNSDNPQNDIGNYQAVTLKPRFVTVDENGNINWNPNRTNLEPGHTYEFYVADLSAWGASQNINNLVDVSDTLYGKMRMTIGVDGKDEMEMYLDTNLVAAKYGISADELKKVDAQFGRIGQKWISHAGVSSGPVHGIILCVGVVGAVYFVRKRKGISELTYA